MDFEELSQKIKELKAQGMTDENILDTFFKAFEKGEMDMTDLEKAAGALGYKVSEDFKKEFEGASVGDLSQEEIESAKEIKPGESKAEFEEKIEDINSGENEKPAPAEDEDEKEKAMKLFGLR